MTKQNNLTFNEVCQVLGKSKRTVSRYIKARKLNPEKIKSQKDVTMQIIALINQKGGVGKTTCAINIGAKINREGVPGQ